MSSKLSAPEARTAALIQEVRLGPIPNTFWLPLWYMMGIVRVESGFDAKRWNTPAWGGIQAGDFAVTGSEGLGQISSVAREDVERAFPGVITLSQTDPLTSITTMMLFFDVLRGRLMPKLGSLPGLWTYLVMAYNAGAGSIEGGFLDWKYYYKWKSALQRYVMLD